MTTIKLNKLLLTAIALAGITVSALPNTTLAQNCRCAVDQCCSQWCNCGTGDNYCTVGCQAGPCIAPPPTNHVSVEDVVTEAFFDGITGEAAESCEAKGFYTRETFLEAVGSYPQFSRVGSVNNSIREIAAFFAHATFETGCKLPLLNNFKN